MSRKGHTMSLNESFFPDKHYTVLRESLDRFSGPEGISKRIAKARKKLAKALEAVEDAIRYCDLLEDELSDMEQDMTFGLEEEDAGY